MFIWQIASFPGLVATYPGPKETDWTALTETSKATYIVTGLQSGTRFWFRVKVVSASGSSQYSAWTSIIAP